MKSHSRGFILPILLIVIALAVLGGGTYYYVQKTKISSKITPGTVTPSSSTTTLLSAIDFSAITPQFVNEGYADIETAPGKIGGNNRYSDGRLLPAYMTAIKKDIAVFSYSNLYPLQYSSNEPVIPIPISDIIRTIRLVAVGHRYVLYEIRSLKTEGGVSIYNIFDLQSQKIVDDAALHVLYVTGTSKMLLFSPDINKICAYKLDTDSCVLMPETELTMGKEYYWDPMGNSIKVVSQTDSSFTITIYSNREKKSREATYAFP